MGQLNVIAVAAMLIMCVLHAAEAVGHPQEKVSHLQFYFHDTVSGKNVTAVQVASAKMTRSSPTLFGGVAVIDDWLTEGPEATSKMVGKAQGLYTSACLEEPHLLMAMTLVFSSGEYNGSTLSVVGINAVFHNVRELPIVGGTGLFRLARGYALAHTYFYDQATGNAIVGYNVTVFH